MINKKILKILDKVEYVSFDIFDTLIVRNCLLPNDIFNIVEYKYNKMYEPILHFSINRIKSSNYLRENSKKEEITLDEIYEGLSKIYSKRICNILKKIEIETELIYTQKNNDQFINDLYEYAIKNKKVIITSDMYLPIECIKQILNKNGINNYEKIYLSCDLNSTKHNGTIFDKIVSDLKVDANKILHIGDDKNSDYIMPKKYGMYSIQYKKYSIIDKIKNKHYKHSTLDLFIKNNFDNDNSIGYDFGYKYFGPLLYGFCNYIKNETNINNINKIYFLARDGFIIKKCFDILYKNKETYYLYASRRSILVSGLYKYNSVVEMINSQKNIEPYISLFNLFRRLGMDDIDYSKELEKIGYIYDKKYNLEELLKEESFTCFIESKYNEIRDNSLKEYNNLSKYLKMNNFNDKIAVVDIGWYCSIQREFAKLFNVEPYGYYFGLKSKKEDMVNNTFGYLYDYKHNTNISIDMDFYFTFFESIFLAQQGSVKNFDSNGNPVLYDYEMTKKETIKIIEDIQEGAIKFCKDLAINNFIGELQNFTEKYFFERFNNVLLNPSLKQANYLGDILYKNDDIFPIAKPKKIVYYIFHPLVLKKDFLNCSWKIGFFKRMLKISYPKFLINYFRKKYRKMYW